MTKIKYPNPNPLTREKLKPGVVFATWSTIRGVIGLDRYEYKITDKKTSFIILNDDVSSYFLFDPSDNKSRDVLEVFKIIGAIVLRGRMQYDGYVIIKEAPESEGSNG